MSDNSSGGSNSFAMFMNNFARKPTALVVGGIANGTN